MANRGYDNGNKGRVDDCHATTRNRAGDGGAAYCDVACPTSVAVQHAQGGAMKSDIPVGSGGKDADGTTTMYKTGMPNLKNIAAYKPGAGGTD